MKKQTLLLTLLALFPLAAFAMASNKPKTTELPKIKAQKIESLKKEEHVNHPVVSMITDKGEIKIELYMDAAPLTAGNFKDLVERKFYNGLTFHRLIHGFMIQGGCPNGDGTGSFVDPKTKQVRYLKMEYTGLQHDRAGRVAMARSQHPDSASSQFFIDLGPQAFLNQKASAPGSGYAVFGQVIEGMEVVYKIMNENVPPKPGSDGTANPVHIKSARMI